MSKFDFDLDTKINNLEFEWRQACDASISARAQYQALAATRSAGPLKLDAARERLARAESQKDGIMARIENLGDVMTRMSRRQGI